MAQIALAARRRWQRIRGPRTNRERLVVILVVAAATLTFDYFLAQRHGFFDLNVYHGAINYWMHQGGSLYDFLSPQTTYGFTYPPFAALLMLPMAWLPFNAAIWISCFAIVIATVIVISWLVDPVVRRESWVRWYTVGLVFAVAIAFEPLRETFLFGQVNMFLVLLVGFDLLILQPRNSKVTGIGIGLATAIKLTPAVYLIYLVVTKRWRAALVAAGTAGVATVLAAALFPDASRVFWTDALWNTDRVGSVAFISNQSLNGAVARLHPAQPSTVLWLASVLVVMVIWLVRVRKAAAAGDELTGFALTGVLGCLISPITWVHHLVWVGPAIVLLLDRARANPDPRRRRRLYGFMVFSYVLLCSRLVWSFNDNFSNPATWLLSNAYVWISIALLVVLPIREPVGAPPSAGEPAGVGEGEPQLQQLDREFAGLLDGERAPATVIAKTVPVVKGERPGVVH